jgi:hypothetical protein
MDILKAADNTAKPITDRHSAAQSYIAEVNTTCLTNSATAIDTSDTRTPATPANTTTNICTTWLGRNFELVSSVLPDSDIAEDSLSDDQFILNYFGERWLCQYTNGTSNSEHGVKSGSDNNSAATSSSGSDHDAAATAAAAAER